MNYYHCCCFSVIVCSLVFLMMMLMMIMIQTILDRLDGIICIYIFICSETIVKLDSYRIHFQETNQAQKRLFDRM